MKSHNPTLSPAIHKLLPTETVLSDNYPMYADHIYIVDNVAVYCEYVNISVGEYKQRHDAKEIRRCSLFGHGKEARVGDRFE